MITSPPAPLPQERGERRLNWLSISPLLVGEGCPQGRGEVTSPTRNPGPKLTRFPLPNRKKYLIISVVRASSPFSLEPIDSNGFRRTPGPSPHPRPLSTYGEGKKAKAAAPFSIPWRRVGDEAETDRSTGRRPSCLLNSKSGAPTVIIILSQKDYIFSPSFDYPLSRFPCHYIL